MANLGSNNTWSSVVLGRTEIAASGMNHLTNQTPWKSDDGLDGCMGDWTHDGTQRVIKSGPLGPCHRVRLNYLESLSVRQPVFGLARQGYLSWFIS